MAGGQALDLEYTGRAADLGDGADGRLREVHAKKTGRLLSVSLELGALHAGADAARRASIASFGRALGLLFQIADDLLDVTADSGTLGKTAGKDSAQGKLTYPSVFGLEGAYRERDAALGSALAGAAAIEGEGGLLGALAGFAGRRSR